MPADQLLPDYDAHRPSASPANLPVTNPVSRDSPLLSHGADRGGAGAPPAQVGTNTPDTNLGPTGVFGRSVRSRASNPTTTTTDTKGTTTMRRITRTIQHLITGSLASQKLARANAARARLTLEAQREEREGFDSYLEAHRAALASLDHEIGLRDDHGGV